MESGPSREGSSQSGSNWCLLGSFCGCKSNIPPNALFGATGDATTLYRFPRFVLLLKFSKEVR
jgi:hypothetical protein